MSFEIAQIDPRNPVVGIVVYEQPAAIVFRIGLRERRVMHITPGEVAEHLLRFLIEAVTGGWIRCEDGDCADVAQRRNAGNINLTRMSAGVEEIIFVLLSGRDVTGQRVRSALGLRCSTLFSATC